jgi:hypothetical protein
MTAQPLLLVQLHPAQLRTKIKAPSQLRDIQADKHKDRQPALTPTCAQIDSCNQPLAQSQWLFSQMTRLIDLILR